MIARDQDRPRRRCLRVVAVDPVAEWWFRPTLAGCNASWPDIAIAVETDHLGVTVGVGPYMALPAASVRDRGIASAPEVLPARVSKARTGLRRTAGAHGGALADSGVVRRAPSGGALALLLLPPLDSLRFFEAAARHQGFARAAEELGVTRAGVAHRVRMLEKHLDVPLFDRHHRGVRLNRRGWAYLKEVQRILAEVHGVSERQRRWPRRVRIVSVEAVAELWLVPRLAAFTAAHPGVAIELETNHRGVDPDRRDFDAWLAYTGETAAPRPVTSREDTLLEETLYEEQLLPVCSPVLLAEVGRPSGPADLGDWPLLYDLGWDADWAYWFARQGQATPDLSRASGFRLYSMLVQAAVTGLGAAIGRPMLIARELASGTLVPLFDRRAEAPERCCLITTAAARQRPEVRAFRAWILDEARAASDPIPRHA